MELDIGLSNLYLRRNVNKDNVTTGNFPATPPALPPKLRQSAQSVQNVQENSNSATALSPNMFCSRCRDGFSQYEKIFNFNGKVWHKQCFVCAQCFHPFPEDICFEFEERMYCEYDFNQLYAPICGLCNKFVLGRVIKAMKRNWHPQCFRCNICEKPLADVGFVTNCGRALCTECNTKLKAERIGKQMCFKCREIIDGDLIRFRGEMYHAYHHNCETCGAELTSDARELQGKLYCLRCHDKMGIPICGACHMPIEGRIVWALGKPWHVEHFVCRKCEKPFLGHQHYEMRGQAYCEYHYHQFFGNLCFACNDVIVGQTFKAMNKSWCVDHFACSACDKKISTKTKFYEFDMKPVCKKCYVKFASELRKRLKKQHESNTSKTLNIVQD